MRTCICIFPLLYHFHSIKLKSCSPERFFPENIWLQPHIVFYTKRHISLSLIQKSKLYSTSRMNVTCLYMRANVSTVHLCSGARVFRQTDNSACVLVLPNINTQWEKVIIIYHLYLMSLWHHNVDTPQN